MRLILIGIAGLIIAHAVLADEQSAHDLSEWMMSHTESGVFLGWANSMDASQIWAEIPTPVRFGGAEIMGMVTAADLGLPISDGFVNVFNDSGSSLGLALLDNDGTYSFGGLAAGTYFVRTDSTGFFDELWNDVPCPQDDCVATSGTPIVLSMTEVATADFILETGGIIAGTVADADGLPIPDGFINVFDASGSSLGLALLDNDGTYSYGGLDAGTYFVRTDSTGFFDELWDDVPCPQGDCVVTSGTPIVLNVTEVATADFVLGSGGEIMGTVTDANLDLPIPDGFINVFDDSGSSLGLALLDNDGTYSFGGLAAGTYFVRTDSTGFFDELWDDIPCPQDDCVVTSGTPIVLTTTEIATVDFVLETGSIITGTVTDADLGLPIPDGFINVFDDSGSSLGLALLDNDGTYSYGGLDAGAYFVRTDSTGFFDELWDDVPCPQDDCVITSGTPIVLSVTEVATADFILETGGIIGGTVTDTDGIPIPDGFINVFDASGSSLGLALLDNDGTYSYGGLDAGTYFVRTDSTGFFDELWDDIPCPQDDCVVTSGTPIVLSVTEVATADFVLGNTSEIFSDGFEAGTLSAWSSSVP